MTMLEKLRKVATGAAILAALAGGVPSASAADGSVEVMAGHKATTLDLKVSGEIAPKTGLFLRDIETIGYDGTVSHFGLADLSYEIAGGVGAVAEIQVAPGMGVVPRIGAQYFGKFGDLSAYVLGTIKTAEHPDGEFMASLRYAPEVAKDVKLPISIEALTSVGEEGHKFSTQKIRAGIELGGKYEVGAGVDLLEVGKDGILEYSAGGFAGIKF